MNKKYLFLVLLMLLYFLVRIPYYGIPPYYEEGCFTDLFYNHIVNPNYILIGKIDGVKIYVPPQHPALMYETISSYGKLWQVLLPFGSWNTIALGVFARFAFSIFQASIVFALILMRLKKNEAKTPLPLIACIVGLCLLPPVIWYSTSLQVDGSVGSLLTGLLALSLLAYRYKLIEARKSLLRVFACALFYGFGKNEWTLAFLAALIVSFIFVFVRKSAFTGNFRSVISLLSIALAGLLVGNLISYLFDPNNYMDGFGVMSGLGKPSLNILETMSWTHRWKLVSLNLILLVAALAGLFPALKKHDIVYLLFFVWGAALLAGFFMSAHALDIRYYAPSFLVLLGILPLAYDQFDSRRVSLLLWATTVIIFLISVPKIIDGIQTLLSFKKMDLYSLNTTQAAPSITDCISAMGPGEAFITGDDFISNAYPDKSTLLQKHGKTLCKSNPEWKFPLDIKIW